MHGQLVRRRLLALATACAVAAAGSAGAARADDAAPCATETPYGMQLTALTGPAGADLTVAVDAAPGCAAVDTLKKIQLKTFGADGKLENVRNITDKAAPNGVANIDLGQLERNRRVEADVLVQTDPTTRAQVVRGHTTTLLRPDVVVESVQAPAQTLTTRPIDIRAQIAELNGDVGANATVTLSWGPTVIATQTSSVSKGGHVSVAFDEVALTTAAPVELTVRVSGVTPGETDATNNARSATVDVSEHELVRSRLVLPSLGGYGAQFNGHVYAPITAAPPATLPDFEAKVKALEPQIVRIFYNELWEERSSPGSRADAAANLASFEEAVELAQEAGATINITYQTAANAKLQPDAYMGRFAAVLDDLVRTHGLGNVRWVTVQNEPNAPTATLTLDQYNALYRALNAQLVARGLRDHIGLMGGDLVESSGLRDQRVWFPWIAANMSDILDAYSVHIYWNYWDLQRMEFRLKDVHKLVTEELPPDQRKPTYIMEFGVRGAQTYPGKPTMTAGSGYWQDGTQLVRTNVAAFQQLWFDLEAAQLGFTAAVKWDAYWSKYDNGTQAYWMIGPAGEGWPLFPAYYATQLLLQTTQRGWQVLGVEPWADDDWKLRDDQDQPLWDQPEKEMAAYAGPNGELTLMGLDTHARDLDTTSVETPAYSIGGLPPNTTFNLALWNATGNGENTVGGTVATSGAGVARFEVPLQAAFALTTVTVT